MNLLHCPRCGTVYVDTAFFDELRCRRKHCREWDTEAGDALGAKLEPVELDEEGDE